MCTMLAIAEVSLDANVVLPEFDRRICSPVFGIWQLWDPQGVVLQDEIEKVQIRAARFLTLKLGV